jgi:hypothetical protein
MLDDLKRVDRLRAAYETSLRNATRQHKRLLAALAAADDPRLALVTLRYTDLVMAEFHAALAEQLAGPDATDEEGTI